MLIESGLKEFMVELKEPIKGLKASQDDVGYIFLRFFGENDPNFIEAAVDKVVEAVELFDHF